MSKKIYFVFGGTRSGKSDYSLELAYNTGGKTAFVATCPPYEDMEERITKHRGERPSEWDTYEEPEKLPELLRSLDGKYNCVLIDCLTLFCSNLMMSEKNDKYIFEQTQEIMSVLKEVSYSSIIVSGEVGLGVHPETSIGNKYRDIVGKANQIAAKGADEVYFVIAGLPQKLK